MKVKIVEKCEVKRVYEVDVETVDGMIDTEKIYDRLYSGELEPTMEEEDGNEVTMYDENDDPIDCQRGDQT